MSVDPSQPVLELAASLRAELARWARGAYPREACGLLIGRRAGERHVVQRVTPARNLEAERAGERYELHPADHLAAHRLAAAHGLEVIGVWHSHPDRPARPSPADRAGAHPGWSHAIVSVSAARCGALRSWRRVGDELVEERRVSERRAPRRPALP